MENNKDVIVLQTLKSMLTYFDAGLDVLVENKMYFKGTEHNLARLELIDDINILIRKIIPLVQKLESMIHESD